MLGSGGPNLRDKGAQQLSCAARGEARRAGIGETAVQRVKTEIIGTTSFDKGRKSSRVPP